MGGLDEVVSEFLVESHDGLNQMDQDLVALEKDPRSADMLDGIFRTVHTIKGTAGLLGYAKLVAVSHVGENLLGRLRDGALALTPELATDLLSMGDALREMLRSVEESGTDGDGDYDALIGRFSGWVDAPSAVSPEVRDPAITVGTQPPAQTVPPNEKRLSIEDVPPSAPAIQASRDEPEVAGENVPDEKVVADSISAQSQAETESPVDGSRAEPTTTSTMAEGSIRVNVEVLDRLMDLMGELVLARNRILQLVGSVDGSAMHSSSQHLHLVTSELQEVVMKVRMQPIRNIWSKFPRIVRDLAISCGKEVRIEMEGEDTELDKTLIETIRDPLTHLVRNAVDHGVESPDDRVARGKPRQGRLYLRAYHEGGQVNIEMSDDGGGIDINLVRSTAIRRGVITNSDAAELTDREVLELMFLPGFSTTESVTEVSGRGVGLDVVKTNIEAIGGLIDIQTVVGAGTTFRIKIPLTLAIIPALLVECDDDRYAIPQVSLHKIVRLKGERAQTAIELIHSAPVFRLRGNLVPLVSLRHELGLSEGRLEGSDPNSLNIVVLEAGGTRFGLVVDRIRDTQEIVTKPLGKQFQGVSFYAGATIMGDGRVSLILDVVGLAKRAHLLTDESKKRAVEQDSQSAGTSLVRRAMLLVEVPGGDQLAVPLEQVAQLEKVPCSMIEHVGTQDVIQYRDGILPLVDLAQLLPEQTAGRPNLGSADAKNLPVIVVSTGEGKVGFVVARIVDIVDVPMLVPGKPSWDASLGSVVIRDRITELINVERLAASVASTYARSAMQTAS